uniref:Putative conserved plasma membrane protein n=1 Tax=Corethrella appendiculata TaxID=1370023 RepID=U5EVG9_9DIPT
MALTNIILLSQITGHVVAFILSMCIIVPMGLHVHSFGGHCLLFASGEWKEDGLFYAIWASQSYCNYPIFVGVALFLVSSIQIYRLSVVMYRELEITFLGLFFDVLFGILLCVMTLISAIMITLGFIEWCSDMTQRFPSCETADGQNITSEAISTSGFYIEMGTAQFGAWSSFAVWVGLSVFALLKLINNHEMRNVKVSMYIERQRLMNEDAYRSSLSDTPEQINQQQQQPHSSVPTNA